MKDNFKFKEGDFVIATCHEDHTTEGYVVDNFVSKDEDGTKQNIVVIGTMGEGNIYVEESDVKAHPNDSGNTWLLRSIDQGLKAFNEKVDMFMEKISVHHQHDEFEDDDDEDEGEEYNN